MLRWKAVLVLLLALLVGCGTVATPAPGSFGTHEAESTHESTAESTTEAEAHSTAETTQESHAEPTIEATTEATTEATVEVTLEATTEVTTEPTVESTTTPTTAPTATPVAEATAETAATAEVGAEGTAAASGKTFVIGDVGASPTSSIERLQPLADYLAAKLSEHGYTAGEVRVAPDFDTIAQWLKSGEVDVLFQTPYPAVLLEDAVGAQTILRRWRGGDFEYNSLIFARADSGIKSLDDLKGHMLAVQDQYSTTAYALPLAYIKEAGLKTSQKETPEESVAADEVGYTNGNSDDNVLQWVLSGKVAAGATDNRTFESIPEETRKDLVILFETEKIPRGVVMVRPGMDADLLADLIAILLKAHEDDEGKAALATFQNTAKFDEFPDGAEAALKRTRELSTLLNQKD